MSDSVPPFVNRNAYPFRAHHFQSRDGAMHYVDEGRGPVVVLVHGTPVWSFVYRQQIAHLIERGFRVIAPDHLGFGLSDQPPDASYRPSAHARRLADLLTALDLRAITLVVHDFGGPIGLSFALDHPDRIARLIVLNTWLWPLNDDARIARGARIASGFLGRFLYTRLNASPRWLIPSSFADRRRLSADVHEHYLAPFRTRMSRMPLWILACELLGSSSWYDSLWQRRELLAGIPMQLVWGMRDPAFGHYLSRWRNAFPHAQVHELQDAGHFVQEEAAEEVSAAIAAAP